jgi:hypothetical protein
MKIEASTKVHEILQIYPELTDYLMDMGLCGCGHDSDLKWDIERIARERNIDLNELLRELNKRIE